MPRPTAVWAAHKVGLGAGCPSVQCKLLYCPLIREGHTSITVKLPWRPTIRVYSFRGAPPSVARVLPCHLNLRASVPPTFPSASFL